MAGFIGKKDVDVETKLKKVETLFGKKKALSEEETKKKKETPKEEPKKKKEAPKEEEVKAPGVPVSFKDYKNTEISSGKLQLKVVKADLTRDTETFGQMDPFVELKMGE